MRTLILSATLCVCTLAAPAARAESPVKPPCTCDDDCKTYYSWAGTFCNYWGSTQGHCSFSGPGTPCKEAGVGLEPAPPSEGGLLSEPGPEQGPWPLPEQGPGLEPAYAESDPWYKDMQAVNPTTDAGPAAPDGGQDSELAGRGGCSVQQGLAGSPWLLALLLLGALHRMRRASRANRYSGFHLR